MYSIMGVEHIEYLGELCMGSKGAFGKVLDMDATIILKDEDHSRALERSMRRAVTSVEKLAIRSSTVLRWPGEDQH